MVLSLMGKSGIARDLQPASEPRKAFTQRAVAHWAWGWSALDLEYQAKVGACPQYMRELYKFDKHWVDSDQVMRCEASVDKSTGAQLTPFAPVPSWESVNGSVVGGPHEERAVEYLAVSKQKFT